MNKENFDLDGKIVLGKSAEGEYIPLKVNSDGQLIIQGGGGGGDFPAPHAWTHLVGGEDPIQTATTERYGLTKIVNSIDSDSVNESVAPAAVKEVNKRVTQFTEEIADVKLNNQKLREDITDIEEDIFNIDGRVDILEEDNKLNKTAIVGLSDGLTTVTATSNKNKQDIVIINNDVDAIENQIISINNELKTKMNAKRPSNLVMNGTGFLEFSRWKNIGIGAFNTIRDQTGLPYFSFDIATGNSYAILESDSMLVYPNETYNLSAEFYQLGQTNSIWIEVLNSANDSILKVLNPTNNFAWHSMDVDFITTNASNIKLRLAVNINKTASFKAWRKIQITFGNGIKDWNLDGDFYAINKFQKYKVTTDDGSVLNLGAGNANNLLYSGFYSLFATAQNIPVADDVYITVERYSSNLIVQTAKRFYSPSLYQRRFVSGTWSAWTANLFDILTYVIRGVGSPEGVVTASVGTIYLNTVSGNQNTTLYVKQTGTGNVGWVAK